MNNRYNAADIEVLSGLDPVKRRPGMYTDTTRPNHLAQEVIDNAVDEALAGHARGIEVILYRDGSCEVSDDGRGMPVDIHPEEGVPGVELILTRLHAGGKFNNRNYTFSGGLHGVGVSVVNALSTLVEVHIKRDGQEHRITFRNGDRDTALEVVGTVGKKNTGTRVRFWPDPKYFDTAKFNLRALRHLLRAKAVLCPGLTVKLTDEATGEQDSWYYEDGLRDYLRGELAGRDVLPVELFVGRLARDLHRSESPFVEPGRPDRTVDHEIRHHASQDGCVRNSFAHRQSSRIRASGRRQPCSCRPCGTEPTYARGRSATKG